MNVRYELAIFGAFVAFFVILFALSVGGIAGLVVAQWLLVGSIEDVPDGYRAMNDRRPSASSDHLRHLLCRRSR